MAIKVSKNTKIALRKKDAKVVRKLIKKKISSKKTKKGWRNVHIDGLDEHLENQRFEERTGDFSKKQDEELFIVDSKADDKLIEVYENKAAQRLALRNSQLKHCDILTSCYTAVPDPVGKRNRVKTPEERKNPITRNNEITRKANGQLTKKEKDALKNRGLAQLKKDKRYKRGDFSTDVWADEEKNNKTIIHGKEIDCEWFTSDTLRHTKPPKKSIRVKTPSIHKIAAVEAPHPGTSYNPSWDDHQQLLHTIAAQEKQLIKEEKHLNRVTDKMFKKVTEDAKESNWLSESSQGLPASKGGVKSETEDEEEDSHPGEVRSINPPAKLKKKTKQQRRKQREQKLLALKLKNAKIEKKKIGDMYKLRKMKSQIETKEVVDEKTREIRLAKEEKKALTEPKVLGKTKFEAPDLDFVMGQDLSGNLRNADPTGNLLRDRYKSLQKRSIVAPSTRSFKLNKAKVKKFIKPDHKISMPDTKSKKQTK